MRITLDDHEVREALLKAAADKTSHAIAMPSIEDGESWFDVTTPNGDVEDIETVSFTINVVA